MNDLQGALLFAGIPIATVGIVWALVFGSTKKTVITKPSDDEND